MSNRRKVGLFGSLAVCLALLAGCGGGVSGDGSGGKNETAARKFTHMMGDIEVPAEPKQVVGLYMEDFLVALGMKPAAQTTIGTFQLQYLQKDIGGQPKLDTSAMNFETLLSLKPDLVLLAFSSYAQNGNYDKYSRIAPTYVFGDDAPDDWRGTLRKVGDLVGKREAADKVLKDYEQKISESRQKLEQTVGRDTVALVRVRSNKEIRLYGGPLGYAGSVLYHDLGLEPPALVKEIAWGDRASHAVISPEILPKLDSEHLFVTVDGGGKELAGELFSTQVWKSLPAVQSGHVYEVPLDHWMTFGPVAYNRKVDDVLQALVK